MSTLTTPATLLDALGEVQVDPQAHRAWVAGRDIEADSTRQLRRLLANALYEVLHTGHPPQEGPPPFRMRDPEFERELAEAVPHQETHSPARVAELVTGEGEPEPRALVALEGVKVWVPYDRLRPGDGCAVGDLVTVANNPRRPALSPGFFLVQGAHPHRTRQLLRVYIHIVDWRHTASLWGSVLERLETAQVAYRAKVLSNKDLYPRRDALVVYLDPEYAGFAQRLAELADGAPGTGVETSWFTRRLGRGVAVAWEPADQRPGMTGLSFGQHRATVVAEALIDAARDARPVAEVLPDRLRSANVDPKDLSRNLDSAPVTAPLPSN